MCQTFLLSPERDLQNKSNTLPSLSETNVYYARNLASGYLNK